MTDNNERMDVL